MGRSVKRYQNAVQILPKPLLTEVQRLAAGKVLYIPYPVTRREINRMKVLDLRMQGYSLNQIAYRMGLTRQGVCRILRQDRQRALTIMNLLYSDGDVPEGENAVAFPSGEMPPSREMPVPKTEESK